jgi:hypothetical protein
MSCVDLLETNTVGPLGSTTARYRRLRLQIGRLVPSNYDVSDRCNLTCEGCLYFEGDERRTHLDDGTVDEWARFFGREARRGVNFAYLAGAEPALQIDRIRAAARHIPAGVIFTNGTRLIPPDIRYRIHVSIWGWRERNAVLRGGDNAPKALRLYARDPRAIFTYTISRKNIDDIYDVAQALHEAGAKLTLSYFSPTSSYLARLEGARDASSPYVRVSTAQDNLVLGRDDYVRARRQIVRAMADFPETVVYSLAYDDWITRRSLYTLDDQGVAVDCGSRNAGRNHHFAVDRTRSSGKCCSPNIDCRECRAYAQGYSSFLIRYNDVRSDPDKLADWLDVWELWARMFMPLPEAHAARAKTLVAAAPDRALLV